MLKYLENSVPRQPQDSRIGWRCIFGVSLVFIFNVSLIPSFEIMFESLFKENYEGSVVVLSSFKFITNFTIIVTGFLIKNLSARLFVTIGSTVTFIGLIMTSFVTTLTQLIFTYSIAIGIGLGLLNPAAFIAVLSCFTCHKEYAISVGFAALGFGQWIMPMIVENILQSFQFQATVLIVSGLSVIGLLGGFLIVPIKWRPCEMEEDDESQPLIRNRSILMNIFRATDMNLLWNSTYIIIVLGLGIVYACSTNLKAILPIYLQKRNFSDFQISYMSLIITLSDITTRLAYPFILKYVIKKSSRFTFLIGVIGLGITRIIIVNCDFINFVILLLTCSALGCFRALTVVNQVFILLDFCEDYCHTKLPGTLGLSVVIKSIMLALFSWIFDEIQKLSQNLQVNFYVHIILFIIIVLMWFLEYYKTRSRNT